MTRRRVWDVAGVRVARDRESQGSYPEGRRRADNIRSACVTRPDRQAHGTPAGAAQGARGAETLREGARCASLAHEAVGAVEGPEVRAGERPQA